MSNNRQTCMLCNALLTVLAIPLTTFGGVAFRIDMDTSTPEFETSRVASTNESFDIEFIMEVTGSTLVSSYGVSIQFDTEELDVDAQGQSVPPGWTAVSTVSVSENMTGDNGSINAALGQVQSYAAVSLSGGTGEGVYSLGTLQVTAVQPTTNAFIDLIPGFFENGIDQINDERGEPLLSGISFQGGSVQAVPEGSSIVFLGLVLGLVTLRLRWANLVPNRSHIR